MHEMSIALAIRQLAARYRPAGCRVQAIYVQIGPLQAIDDTAMQWAWEAVSKGTDYEEADLKLESLPWRVRCPNCGHRWQTDLLDSTCICGSRRGIPEAGDELLVTHLDVTEDNRSAHETRAEVDSRSPGKSL